MSKDPAVLFYTSDFLTGTSRLTDAQCGQYIRALCSQHQEGHFTIDELTQILKSNDSPVWKKFKQDSEGLFFNERMDEEIEKRVSYCNSKSHKGVAGRKKKSSDNHTITGRIPVGNHTENDTENDIVNDSDLKEGMQGEIPEERKKKTFIPPTFEEFESYCVENNHKGIARAAYEGYRVADWHDSRGKKIKNWKQKLCHVWFREENVDGKIIPRAYGTVTPSKQTLEDQARRFLDNHRGEE